MARYVVSIGQTAVATSPGDLIEMIGLGSCAGIFISVPGKIAVAAHSLLAQPREGAAPEQPGKYVATAVPFLLEELAKAGVATARCKAWVVGLRCHRGTQYRPGHLAAAEERVPSRRCTCRRSLGAASDARLRHGGVHLQCGERVMELCCTGFPVRLRRHFAGTNRIHEVS